jgi:hypothetical protein
MKWPLLLFLHVLLVETSSSMPSISTSTSSDVSAECISYEKQPNIFPVADIIPSQSVKYTNLKYMAKEKLLFCLIPKVASSSFLRLFSRIAGLPLKDSKAQLRLGVADARDIEALRQGRYRTLSSFDSLVASNLSLAYQALNSPAWTRVAVLRDPAERLLSAYLDKIQATTAFSRHKLLVYADILGVAAGLPPDAPVSAVEQALRGVSFAEFVDQVARRGSERPAVWNPHWRPQSDFCGLRQIAPRLDMVMVLNRNSSTTTQFIRCLFSSLVRKRRMDSDVNELKYTSMRKYTRGRKGGGFKYTPKVGLLEYFSQIEEELQGRPREQAGGGVANSGHVSHARDRMSKMYNESLLQTVVQLYQNDYQLLHQYTSADATAAQHNNDT